MRGLAVAALLVAAAGSAFPAELADERTRFHALLESSLSGAIGGEVRFGEVDVDLTGLGISFRDLRVVLPAEGAPPLRIVAPGGRLALPWSGLPGFAAGRIRISELVLQEPRIDLDAAFFRARRARGSRRAVDVAVDRLRVVGGRLSYHDEAAGLRLELEEVSAEGNWDAYRHALRADASCRGSVLHPPLVRPLPFSAKGRLDASARGVELRSVDVITGGLRAVLNGRAILGEEKSFHAGGRVTGDVSSVQPWLDERAPVLEGRAEGDLIVDWSSRSSWSVTGRAAVAEARVGPLRAASATADLRIVSGALDLRGLTAEAYGGRVDGEVDVRFDDPVRFRARLEGRGLDAPAVLNLASIPLPLASALDGSFVLEGIAADPASWRGAADFAAIGRPASPTAVRVEGRGRVVFEEGGVRVAAPELKTSNAAFRLEADAGTGKGPRRGVVTLDGRTTDASGTQHDVQVVASALGVGLPDVASEPLRGAGSVSATIGLGADEPFALDLRLAEGSWSGIEFERADFAMRVEKGRVVIERAEATKGPQRLSAAATFGEIPLRLIEGGARWDRVDLRPVVARFAVEADLVGTASGFMDVHEEHDRLVGSGEVVVEDVLVGGEAVDRASTPVRLDASRLELERIEARGPGLNAEGRATVDVGARTVAGFIEAARIVPERLALARKFDWVSIGEIEGSGPWAWSERGLEGEIVIAVNDIALPSPVAGAPAIGIGGAGGTVAVAAGVARVTLRSEDEATWAIDGSLSLGPEAEIDGTITIDALGEEFRTMDGDIGLRGRGRASLRGPTSRPSELVAEGWIDEARVRFGSSVLETLERVPIALAGGVARVGPARLLGEYSALEGSLGYTIESGALDGALRGAVDLAALSAVWSDLRASGSTDLDVSVTGTAEVPRLAGHLRLDDGYARVLGFPAALEHVNLDVVLDGDAARSKMTAVCGGGEVRAEGTMSVDPDRGAVFRVAVEASQVTAAFPEGFQGLYDGRFEVDGSTDGLKISGRVDLRRGVYDREIDVATLFADEALDASAAAEEGVASRVSLDLRVVSDGDLRVRNSIARLEARGDLVIGGTLAIPTYAGQIVLFEGGTVRFRDVSYRVDSGTVDFSDPSRFNPILQIRGRTRVREYDITLRIEGPADRLRYELSSTPALSEQDIVALLLTGRTIEAQNASSDARSMTTDLAAGYFAGLLTSRFGGDLQKSLGLERLVIDPTILEGRADPTARVTVAKRVGDAVRLVYSTDLGDATGEFYEIEWDVSRKLRLSMNHDASAGIGGEVTYSDRFRAPKSEEWRREREETTPPPRVAAVVVRAVDPLRAARLAKELEIRAGDPYGRARTYEAVDALRRALVAEGHIEAKVAVDVTSVPDAPPPGEVHLVYRVEEGPRVIVRVAGPSWRERRRDRRLLDRFWEQSIVTTDIYEEAVGTLLADLHRRGFLAADVEQDHRDETVGRVVLYSVDPGEKVRVRAVRLEGVAGLPVRRVQARMLTREDSAFSEGILNPDVLAEDVRAVAALYRSEGFLAVRIERPEVRLTPSADEATVTIRIAEGPRFTVGEVAVSGNGPLSESDVVAASGLKRGEVFSTLALREADSRVRSAVDRAGYPDAQVDSEFRLDGGAANVTFRIAAGSHARVASVEIVGQRKTKERVIRRAIRLAPGDPISREALLEAQRSLYALGLFRRVSVVAAQPEGTSAEGRTVRVTIEEAAPIGLTLGAGYDSDRGAQGNYSISHDNVAGTGRSVALQGRASGTERRTQLVGKDPRLFGSTLIGLAVLSSELEEKDGFTIDRLSMNLRVEGRVTRRWKQYVRYGYQRVDLTDISDVLAVIRDKVNNLELGDVGMAFIRDTRDDPFQPKRGGLAVFDVQAFARPFGSEASFVKTLLQGTLTRGLSKGASYGVWLRLGAGVPFGPTSSVPLAERFFAGGETTLRGFERDQVGPVLGDVAPAGTIDPEAASVPIGGEALFLLNQEWRFPIWKAIRGVLFYDAGNVYPRLRDFDLTDLRHAAGLGVRIETPVGPLRIEYGWKLDRRDDESRGQLHFAIGSVY